VPLGVSLGDRVDAEVRNQARSQAQVVAASAPELLEHSERAALRRLVDKSAEAQRGRVIVVNRAGRVVADSAGPGELGAEYAGRPEIAAALAGHSFQATRDSATLGTPILATAVPVFHGSTPDGAVRLTQSVDAVHRATRKAILGLVLLGGVVLLLGVTAAALIARDTSAPIRRLESAAERIEAGDLSASAPVEGSSEQRSLARSFNRMTARLRRLLRGQQDFVADASHQLRTPLTGIRLSLEELREEIGDDGWRAGELDAGLEEIDRLSHVVDELLILSRAGEHELPAEEIDLAAAGRRGCERWRKAAAEREVGLDCRAETGAGSVTCAGADLERALDSLIENAVLYSPPGGEVEVVASPGRIEVLDRGPGLEPGEEEAVFERFHRGSAGRQGAKGTGLGLPIARELASQWGGFIRIENRPGGGARATIELPRTAIAAPAGGERR
jgi:signal transduction histidine kinase